MPRVIDCHVHSLDDSHVAWAREIGYEKVCLMDRDPAVLADAMRRHPDFVVGLGWLPMLPDAVDRALAAVDRFVAAGCRGFKICAAAGPYDDERFYPVYERIEALRLPIFFHTGWLDQRLCLSSYREMAPYRLKAAWYLPLTLDRIALDFPQLKIVAFHMGGSYIADAALLMLNHPNVYADACRVLRPFDTFWSQIGGADRGPAILAKTVFGTDGMASRVTIEGKLTEFGQLMDHLNLGRGLRERLYHRTAKRILGMDDELRKRAVASRVAALPPLALALDAPESGVPIEDFETRDGERPQHGTCVRVTCDGATLRFVLRCTEPLPQRLSVGNGPLSEIWQDDCVEIFLAPQGDGTYLHLVISAGGRAFVEQGRYTALTPFPCAVRVAADHWRAALDVPFAVLGAAPEAGARWSLNICRNRTPPPAEVSTWNEVGLTFHDAAAFGWLAFT